MNVEHLLESNLHLIWFLTKLGVKLLGVYVWFTEYNLRKKVCVDKGWRKAHKFARKTKTHPHRHSHKEGRKVSTMNFTSSNKKRCFESNSVVDHHNEGVPMMWARIDLARTTKPGIDIRTSLPPPKEIGSHFMVNLNTPSTTSSDGSSSKFSEDQHHLFKKAKAVKPIDVTFVREDIDATIERLERSLMTPPTPTTTTATRRTMSPLQQERRHRHGKKSKLSSPTRSFEEVRNDWMLGGHHQGLLCLASIYTNIENSNGRRHPTPSFIPL